jgi:uncharacterized iron-regulated membrane protein
MRESQLRKFHRRVGMVLVAFLMIQAATGGALSFSELISHAGWTSQRSRDLEGKPEMERAPGEDLGFHSLKEISESIHSGGGPWGALYRMVLGTCVLWMGVSGAWIFVKVQRRSRKPKGA